MEHDQENDGTAFIYLLNPSGGILQHDRLLTEILLEEGSRALASTPSNTKFYRMDEGCARIVNRITLRAGSVLEYLPEHNVPFAESEAYQETEFYLDSSSILIASDMVTAGRVSRGEIFDYNLYSSKTKIFVDGKLEIYDHSRMEPKRQDMAAMGLLEGRQSNGTVYVYAKDKCGRLSEKLARMKPEGSVYYAAGSITDDLLIVRFMGDSIIELRETVLSVWNEIRKELLGKPAVRLRKY